MALVSVLHVDATGPFCASFQRMMLRLAEAGGMKLHFDTATTFSEACERLGGGCYCAVIADARVPGGTVFDLLGTLSAWAHPPPVLLLANTLSGEDVRRAFVLGARDVFFKDAGMDGYLAVYRTLETVLCDGATSPCALSRDAALSRTALSFFTLGEGDDIFSHIGKELSHLMGAGLAMVLSYDPLCNTYVVRALEGRTKDVARVTDTLGSGFVGAPLRLDTELLRAYDASRLTPLGVTMSGLSGGTVPPALDTYLSERLGITAAHVRGLMYEGELHAVVIVFEQAAPVCLDTALLDAFLDQATVSLHRACLERRVHEQRDELSLFAHTLLHEIRNDITVIQGYADLLGEHDPDGYAGIIKKKAAHLYDFVRTGVALADAGTAIGSREPIDMNGLADEVARDVLPRSLRYTRSDLPPLVCSRQRMHQVLRNLFQNVVDHAAASAVHVSGALLHNACSYTVDDNGRGITGDRERLFSWGYTTSATGNGFGLAIVRRLVQAHGGTVYVERSDERGTAITFVVPSTLAPGAPTAI